MVIAIILLLILNAIIVRNVQKNSKELDTLAEETQIFLIDIDKRLKALEKEKKENEKI